MRQSLKTGFSFGLTSGIITTLGLMIGINAGTHSRLAVIGAILMIAIADAISDAFSIHVSEESKKNYVKRDVLESALSTFSSKFLFTLTFVIPVMLLELSTAIIVSAVWGLLALTVLSFFSAKSQKKNPFSVISEHLIIAVLVISITQYAGMLIYAMFD
ncbi:MAG: hypothetical protein ABIF08_00945 [Nanoarchaeota archaeon]